MTRMSLTFIRLSIAAVVGGVALSWSGQLPLDAQSSLMSSADARIGRPLTPIRGRGAAHHATCCGRRRGRCGYGGRRGGADGSRTGVHTGCRRLRTRRHRLPVSQTIV